MSDMGRVETAKNQNFDFMVDLFVVLSTSFLLLWLFYIPRIREVQSPLEQVLWYNWKWVGLLGLFAFFSLTVTLVFRKLLSLNGFLPVLLRWLFLGAIVVASVLIPLFLYQLKQLQDLHQKHFAQRQRDLQQAESQLQEKKKRILEIEKELQGLKKNAQDLPLLRQKETSLQQELSYLQDSYGLLESTKKSAEKDYEKQIFLLQRELSQKIEQEQVKEEDALKQFIEQKSRYQPNPLLDLGDPAEFRGPLEQLLPRPIPPPLTPEEKLAQQLSKAVILSALVFCFGPAGFAFSGLFDDISYQDREVLASFSEQVLTGKEIRIEAVQDYWDKLGTTGLEDPEKFYQAMKNFFQKAKTYEKLPTRDSDRFQTRCDQILLALQDPLVLQLSRVIGVERTLQLYQKLPASLQKDPELFKRNAKILWESELSRPSSLHQEAFQKAILFYIQNVWKLDPPTFQTFQKELETLFF
jgi:hypothetical protein